MREQWIELGMRTGTRALLDKYLGEILSSLLDINYSNPTVEFLGFSSNDLGGYSVVYSCEADLEEQRVRCHLKVAAEPINLELRYVEAVSGVNKLRFPLTPVKDAQGRITDWVKYAA